ncbi:MAG: OmpH family outer membrane protein [Balneolaceae bacterium]
MINRVIQNGFFALLLFFSFQPLSAQAQDMKIGYVEPRAILERMPEMRAVEQRMQNFIERKRNELSTQEQSFQEELELYQQKVGVISDTARQQEEERLGQLQMELQQSQNQIRQEIQQRQSELMAPLLEQVQGAINEVASEMGIDYVLNTTTSTGDVVILYVREELREQYDITDAVMQNLGI